MADKKHLSQEEFIKGRGAQVKTQNKFLKLQYVREHEEALDEPWELEATTQYYVETPKKMINKVTSPDIGPNAYSMNPYQGCEHGCIYCFARNTHEYYGFSAGLDFETKIIAKPNAHEILRKQFDNKNWVPGPIMLSGNTDCYQPAERKFGITRKILEVCHEYKNPVSIITKNALILRDTDLLADMAAERLVSVNVSITSLDEQLRLKLEPRTVSAAKRLEVVRKLSERKIPVRVLAAPMIPFLNSSELPEIMKAAAENGAFDASFIVVRLNGSIGDIFTDWIHKAFPDKADRVLNTIREIHGGKLNDSRFGTRMRGEGNFAASMAALYQVSRRKYFRGRGAEGLDCEAFRRPPKGQLDLF